MASEIDKVIEIAKNEIGYLEKKTNAFLDEKTTNAGKNNYTKYARDLDNIKGWYNGKKQGFAWCDMFVDWCFVKAFGIERARELLCQTGTLGAGCAFSRNYYKVKGQLFDKPMAGDQIFFKNNSGVITHTGLVYKVDSNYVYTIEGNTSSDVGVVANGGSVNDKKYKLNYSLLAGFGRPKYNEKTTATTTTTTTTTKTIEQLAKEVIDNKWGNGEIRKEKLTKAGYDYKKIQDKVNEILKTKPVQKVTLKTKTITAVKGLHLRSKANKDSTSLGVFKKGTKVVVEKENYATADGYKWDKVTIDKKTGYMANKYLK